MSPVGVSKVSKPLSNQPVDYYSCFHSNSRQLIDRQCRAVTASKVLIDYGFQVKKEGSSGGSGRK